MVSSSGWSSSPAWSSAGSPRLPARTRCFWTRSARRCRPRSGPPSTRRSRSASAFVEACAAAGERLVLSYPRVDGQTGSERVPSSFLLRAARAVPGAARLRRGPARLASAGETSLGRPYPRHVPDLALDLVERDLALVASGQKGAARHLLSEAPNVARAVEAERASWLPELTVWDGLVDMTASGDAANRLRLNGREVSASEMEALGACPYRHFLKVGLRLRKWEEPERAYAIAAMDSGTIMHAVLETLFAELKTEEPAAAAPRTGCQRQRRGAAKLIDEEFAGVYRRWRRRPSRAGQRRAGSDARGYGRPARTRGRGADRVRARSVRAGSSTNLPFEFAPGRSLMFRGIMDRLDVATRPKRVRVIDYKTGNFDWKEDDRVQGRPEGPARHLRPRGRGRLSESRRGGVPLLLQHLTQPLSRAAR